MRRSVGSILALACGQVVSGVVPAKAQIIARYFPDDLPGYGADTTGSVLTRQMVGSAHQGIQVGDYIIRPSVQQTVGYNANVLATPGTSSAELDTSASVRLASDWSRNAIGMTASFLNKAYPSLSAASYTNWNVAAGGTVDLGHDRASFGYSHYNLNLSATDLGNFGVANPVPYSADDLRGSYTKRWGRMSVIPAASWDHYVFGSAPGSSVFGSRDFSSLGHEVISQMLQSRLAVSQGNAIVAILRLSEARYVSRRNTQRADYIDGGGFIGVDLRADPVLQYRLLVGGESRHFTQGAASSVITPTAEANVTWTAGRRNTVTLMGWRGIFDPTSPFSRNQTMSTLRVQLDHELHHDLYIRGSAGVARTDASAGRGQSTRHQTQFSFGVSVNWTINRDFSASLSYNHMNSYSRNGIVTATEYGTSRSVYAVDAVMLNVSFAR